MTMFAIINQRLSDACFRPISSVTILKGSENIITFEVFGEELVYYPTVRVRDCTFKISDQTIKQLFEILQDRWLLQRIVRRSF